MRRVGKRTNFALWDYDRLRRELLSRPRVILAAFARCQVECLTQLETFRRIQIVDPPAALRIEAVARSMGIPVELDDLLDGVDVLCDKPGEV